MSNLNTREWRHLIDDIVLDKLVKRSSDKGQVETIFLTGSYVRSTLNVAGPNLNLYFIAAPQQANLVRLDLAGTFADLRADLRRQGVELAIDCHPFTISQNDPEWMAAPKLTLTTKVFAGERANSTERLGVSPTIGYGWWATHQILLGADDALDFLSVPPVRDESWFAGASAALLSYRNMLDHLPWAINPTAQTSFFVQEVVRYAEETIKDGVHFGLSDDEVASGDALGILHDWNEVAPDFFEDRYGSRGLDAVRTVQRLKEAASTPEAVEPAAALNAWLQAIDVWAVVWEKYRVLSITSGLSASYRTLRTWM